MFDSQNFTMRGLPKGRLMLLKCPMRIDLRRLLVVQFRSIFICGPRSTLCFQLGPGWWQFRAIGFHMFFSLRSRVCLSPPSPQRGSPFVEYPKWSFWPCVHSWLESLCSALPFLPADNMLVAPRRVLADVLPCSFVCLGWRCTVNPGLPRSGTRSSSLPCHLHGPW